MECEHAAIYWMRAEARDHFIWPKHTTTIEWWCDKTRKHFNATKKNRGKNEQILLQYNIDALIISAVIAWDSFSLFFHCIRWVWPDGSHFDTLSKREVGNLYASNWFMRHKGSHMSCNRITISPGPKFVNDWISGAIGKLAIFRLRTYIYINAKHYCVNARPSCEYKRLNSSNPTYEITINRIDSIQ